jgi:hypothetical protein
MAKPRPPQKGDLVEVAWCDITEDALGNTDTACPIPRLTIGYFWDQKDVNLHGIKVNVLVTCTTLDTDGAHQQGWTAFPVGCVLQVRVLRRMKAKRE